MRDGNYDGKTLEDKSIRDMFTFESVINSEWYAERLITRQQIEVNHLQTVLADLQSLPAEEKTPQTAAEIDSIRAKIKTVKSMGFLKSLAGTLGADPFVL